MTSKTSAWDVWERDFKKGDEVILVDDNTMLDWGILDYNDKEVVLSSGLRPPRHYPHHKIVLICHDGFPMRKFMAPWPHEAFDYEMLPEVMRAALAAENQDQIKQELKSIEKVAAKMGISQTAFYDYETVKSALKIMEALAKPFVSFGKKIKEQIREKEDRVSRVYYGHPIELFPTTLELFNRGNSTTWFWSNHPQEEVLCMTDKQGLKCQLWDLAGVYHFEV